MLRSKCILNIHILDKRFEHACEHVIRIICVKSLFLTCIYSYSVSSLGGGITLCLGLLLKPF